MTLSVLYFGSYDRGVGRNAVIREGLRAAGVEVRECHACLWRDTTDKLASARDPAHTALAGARLAATWRDLAACHVRARDYDVMLVGATAHLDLPLARLLTRSRGRPLVFDPLVSMTETVRDRALLPRRSRRLEALARLERGLFRLPDLCLVDTAAHAESFARELGLDPARAAVLPAGTPSVYRLRATPYEPRTEGEPFRVLYFGQYIPLHGLETVLHAADRLRDRLDVVFELVGVGQMLPAIHRLAARLALPNVRFHSRWLSPERLADEHIAATDLCVGVFGTQPKTARVVPYKVYTALASGRAVVTAGTPAVREVLAPGDEVWTVPPGDPDALAGAITLLANDPVLCQRLARTGQAAYDARFRSEVLGAELHAVLNELCRTRADRRAWAMPGHPDRPGVGAPARAVDAPYVGPRHRWRTGLLADALLGAAPDGPLLDAGCGHGALARRLAATGRTVLAFDPNPATIASARRLAQSAGVSDRVLVLRADATAVPFADGSLSGAAAGEILEHIADDALAVSELARVLVPGGALAVTVPAGARRMGTVDRSAGHHRRYDRTDLADILTGAGLVLGEQRGWGFPFGRLYDRFVQRPALAARGRALGPIVGRMAGRRVVDVAFRGLFALDERLPADGRGSGWLAVARRPKR